MKTFSNFTSAIYEAKTHLKQRHQVVKPKTWQSIDVTKRPEFESYEIMWFGLCVDIHPRFSLTRWQQDIRPNLPWADNHFEERVCGYPLNPGTEWANWPWGKSADNFRKSHMFNHTYAERYWPKYATKLGPINTYAEALDAAGRMTDKAYRGIRYDYGDLNDVIALMVKDPLTRQAYLPIFFPEDTGAVHGDRVPCSIGYSFFIRNGRLDIYYYLRSCDFIRHFRDDIYLTLKLQLWMVEQLRARGVELTSGNFLMQIGSLHVFKNDMLSL